MEYTGCSLNIIVFFSRSLESLPPHPHQHSAAIGCTKYYQPIGVTVHSHCIESFEGVYSEGGIAVNCEKNTIFPEHPVILYLKYTHVSLHDVKRYLQLLLSVRLQRSVLYQGTIYIFIYMYCIYQFNLYILVIKIVNTQTMGR